MLPLGRIYTRRVIPSASFFEDSVHVCEESGLLLFLDARLLLRKLQHRLSGGHAIPRAQAFLDQEVNNKNEQEVRLCPQHLFQNTFRSISVNTKYHPPVLFRPVLPAVNSFDQEYQGLTSANIRCVGGLMHQYRYHPIRRRVGWRQRHQHRTMRSTMRTWKILSSGPLQALLLG